MVIVIVIYLMPLAVTHIIPAIALFNLIKNKLLLQKYFGPDILFFVAIGAILPDVDIALRWILRIFDYNFSHGTYTHTLFFAFLFLLPALIFGLIKVACFVRSHKTCYTRAAIYLTVISGGIVLHLFLDYFIGGGAENGVMWFFPISNETYKIHLISKIPLRNLPEALDVVILLVWIYFKSPLLIDGRKSGKIYD